MAYPAKSTSDCATPCSTSTSSPTALPATTRLSESSGHVRRSCTLVGSRPQTSRSAEAVRVLTFCGPCLATDLAFVTRYQLPYVRRRLILFAMMLLFCAQAEGVLTNSLRDGWFILLRIIIPAALIITGALLLSPLVRWWRTVVIVSILSTYGCLLGAIGYHTIALEDTYGDFHFVSMLAWLFVFQQAAALLFALDFVQLLFLLPALWAMHVTTSCYIWGTAVAEPHGFQILVNSLLLSAVGLLLLLLSLRRLNRFERQSFVNSFVLCNKVSTQSEQIRGGADSELLAIFSNPRSGSPLQLGRELKFLLNSLPASQLAIEPAATLIDVRAAISQKNPRLLLFSGHSFMGCLAFEMEDGRVDLPPPRHFIAQLQPQLAPRLQCVALNGCETAELGFQIVSELPWLRVICWHVHKPNPHPNPNPNPRPNPNSNSNPNPNPNQVHPG